ncbi:MAG: hypothetical protein ACI9VL_001189 [Colwellia sp.]
MTSYCSIKRLALIYFPCAQQDHKLNRIGISSSLKVIAFHIFSR